MLFREGTGKSVTVHQSIKSLIKEIRKRPNVIMERDCAEEVYQGGHSIDNWVANLVVTQNWR